jgi:predicted NBD/HSP70 family sugar kinase
MPDIPYLAERSRLIGKSLARAAAAGDHPALAKWALRQADVDTSIATAINPVADEEPVVIGVGPPPSFAPSNRISSKLYGPWGLAWFRASFPDAYVNYPPVVGLVDPERLVAKATADGVLAQVCAAGLVGVPGFFAVTCDWSLFSGLVTKSGSEPSATVWVMGKVVAETTIVNEAIWEWAADNGLDPS